MRMHLSALTIGAALAIGGAHTAAARPALASRIALPDPSVITHFEQAGMREVAPHVLTAGQLAQVDKALAALPALHRRVLGRHLRRLSFVDGIPGAGTGLTSAVEDTELFDITLRASILDETLTQFLTAKERRLFAPDGSGHTVTVEGRGADALTYVLLHEATHVVDMALGVSKQADSALTRGIWDRRGADGRHTALLPPLAGSKALASRFRGAGLIPAGQARAHYDALAATPFVSLYATAAAPEDLAELVAWRVMSAHYAGELAISVRDVRGALLKRYEPLQFPGVAARMHAVDRLLQGYGDGGEK